MFGIKGQPVRHLSALFIEILHIAVIHVKPLYATRKTSKPLSAVSTFKVWPKPGVKDPPFHIYKPGLIELQSEWNLDLNLYITKSLGKTNDILHPSNSKRTSIQPARLRCNLYSKHFSLSFPRPFLIIYSRGSTVRTPIFNEELSPGCLTSSLS